MGFSLCLDGLECLGSGPTFTMSISGGRCGFGRPASPGQPGGGMGWESAGPPGRLIPECIMPGMFGIPGILAATGGDLCLGHMVIVMLQSG